MNRNGRLFLLWLVAVISFVLILLSQPWQVVNTWYYVSQIIGGLLVAFILLPAIYFVVIGIMDWVDGGW